MDDTNDSETRASDASTRSDRLSTSRRTFLTASAVGLGGLAATSTGVAADEHTDDEGEDDEGEAPGPFATVEFSNQLAGETTVTVDSVVLSTSGFVAIHDARLLEGKPLESVVGVTEYLDAGPHYDVEVTLFEDVPGATFDGESLSEGQPLFAMPHRNVNRDTTYEFVSSGGQLDGPFVDDGQPVLDLGFAGSDAGKVFEFATVDFENQETDGEEIVVDEVVLSDGGFVAIHDARLFEGQALESVVGVSEYLEAGEHYQVEVELFDVPGVEFEEDELAEDQPLVPMPHYDTDGDEEYGFVATEGAEDGPYTDNGQAVVDFGFVTLEDDDDDKEKGNGGDDDGNDGNGEENSGNRGDGGNDGGN